MRRYTMGLAAMAIGAAGSAGAKTFDLVLAPVATPTPSQSALLERGETFWETLITGYRGGIDIPRLTVSIGVDAFDGPGGTLAAASVIDVTEQAGFVLPTFSFIDFDIADLEELEADDDLFAILVHELAHALGFGELWSANGVYDAGSGRYLGREGLATYRAEFDPTARFVPVDIVSGIGTDGAHWDEDWAGGFDEVMTGFFDPPEYLSDTTIASFRDMGYTTVPVVGDVAPVPLPATGLLLLGAAGVLGLRRRNCRA